MMKREQYDAIMKAAREYADAERKLGTGAAFFGIESSQFTDRSGRVTERHANLCRVVAEALGL